MDVKSIPLSINFPAILIVSFVTLLYLKTPVSCIIPVYKHSATSLLIFSSSNVVYSNSAVALAVGTI